MAWISVGFERFDASSRAVRWSLSSDRTMRARRRGSWARSRTASRYWSMGSGMGGLMAGGSGMGCSEDEFHAAGDFVPGGEAGFEFGAAGGGEGVVASSAALIRGDVFAGD